MNDFSNWLSTVSSVAQVLIGVITLLTVYIAAVQLASQNRMYRLGLSWRSIGPWKSKVAKLALLGLQRKIYAPNVSLTFLVKKNWKPNVIFPNGIPKSCNPDLEQGENIQAKSSWVNFMQALSLSPDDGALYEMRDASELVNGRVPMDWAGKDLVGLCSILGFQSHESNPSFKSPMPLPMQWSGPLGWMQFRSSSSGCVAEFRRRMEMFNQISDSMHCGWKKYPFPQECRFLKSRLWNSINGFSLLEGTLFLGGADKGKRPQETEEDDLEIPQAELFGELMSSDFSDEEIMRKLFGKKEDRPKALRRGVERGGQGLAQRNRDGDMPDFLDEVLRDTMDSSNRKQVMRPCPGLLSVSVQGELAYNRGLSIEECQEYDRKYTVAEDVDRIKYPYNLGDLYMDPTLLGLMKEALLLLKPDGFFFSPTYSLYRDVCEVYEHIEEQSNKLRQIFPPNFVPQLQHNESYLYYAMSLCNELQSTRKTARAVFSVDDMRLLAKASCSLKEFISPKADDHGSDLVWAMLYCPELSCDIRISLKDANISNFLAAKATCDGGILDCTALLATDTAMNEKTGRYEIPLISDGEYTGSQVLAALSDVFITFFWIEKKWTTDVAAYDTTMPQSVIMC